MKRSTVDEDEEGDTTGILGGGNNNSNKSERRSPRAPPPPPPDNNKIRLLLHAVDGCVPFLNPAQLEAHFPPPPSPLSSSQKNDDDLLWIGLSVRDTCVVPVFDDGSANADAEQNGSNINNNTRKKKKEKPSKEKDDDKKNKKARGYTFAGNIQPDPWLLPYTRVTVPLFLEDDFLLRKTKKTTTTTTNTNTTITTSRSQKRNANNDQYCQVWTSHGRQKLTPDCYTKASKSLHSHFTVPLYDWIPFTDVEEDDTNNNDQNKKKKQKQKQKLEKTIERVITRNQQWFGHIHDEWTTDLGSSTLSYTAQKKKEEEGTTTLWSPILLPPIGNQYNNSNNNKGEDDDDNNDNNDKKTNFLLQQEVSLSSYNDKDGNDDVVSGVAFIGPWTSGVIPHYFDSSSSLSSSSSSTTNPNSHSHVLPRWRAVLTTSSLSQIIGIASEGYINVIGTSLPTQWAKDKKALGIINLSPFLVETINNNSKSTTTSSKRIKLDNNDDNNKSHLDCDGCMDMSEKMYQRDTSPLVVGCQCMVCSRTRFSRAYIHHLVCAKELLAEILIFAHNLHHLLELIRAFNTTCGDLEKREELTSFLRKQFEN